MNEAVTSSLASLSIDAWTDSIYIERFWRSLKYEEVYQRAYQSQMLNGGSTDTSRDTTQFAHSHPWGETPDMIHSLTPIGELLKATYEDQPRHLFLKKAVTKTGACILEAK
jgi:hypothetical protein